MYRCANPSWPIKGKIIERQLQVGKPEHFEGTKAMLLAVLYCDPDRIAAAAFACDQAPHGDAYWTEVFSGEIEKGSIYETAYINVQNHELSFKLMNLGIDSSYDGRELAKELDAVAVPDYAPKRHAA